MTANPCWKGRPDGKVRVLVTGVGGNVGQGILEALAASGLARRVVGTDSEPLSAGLFAVDKGYRVPMADDPGFLEAFIDILDAEKVEIVLIGADAETLHLAALADEIKERTGVFVLVSSKDVVERSHDKLLTARWFEGQGLLHPATVRADDKAGLRKLASSNGFPLLLKPRTGFSSRGVVVIYDESTLFELAGRLGADGIVQAYVGSADQEYTASVFCGETGRVDACFVARRDLVTGMSFRIETVSDEALREHVAAWGRRYGGLGPINFQFRLTENGPVCFEVNARFSGTMGLRYRFGYNDVEFAVRRFVLGEKISQPEIVAGMAFRYWSSLFLPGADRRQLIESLGGAASVKTLEKD